MSATAVFAWTRRHWFWVAVTLFLFVFYLFTPRTVDDYTFYSFQNSIHSVADFVHANSYLYKHLNGRVLGNLIALIFAQSVVLSAIVRTIVTLVIFVGVAKLLPVKNRSVTMLFVVALFVVPLEIFRQTYAWRAGFYNYVVPVALLVLIYHLVVWSRLAVNNRTWRRRIAVAIVLFLISLASTLFAENITIGWVAATIIVLAIVIWRYRALTLQAVSLLVGALVGLGVMFSSPIYGRVERGVSVGYQKIGHGLIGTLRMVRDNAVSYADLLIRDHAVIVIVLTLVAAIVGMGYLRQVRGKRHTAMLTALVAIVVMAVALLLTANLSSSTALPSVAVNLYAFGVLFAALIFIPLASVIIWFSVKDRRVAATSAALLLASVLFTVSLLAAYPFGARNFYVAYIMQALALAIVILHLVSRRLDQWDKYLVPIAKTVVITVACFYLVVFAILFVRTIQNDTTIKAGIAHGSKLIHIAPYPFSSLLQDANDNVSIKRMEHVYRQCQCAYLICHSCATDTEIRFK